MNITFKKLEIEDIERIMPYFNLRSNKTCDSVMLDSYIWRKYYDLEYAIVDEKALLYILHMDGMYYSTMPWCKEEDLEYYFYLLVNYFNEELKVPFRIYLADERAIELLHLDPAEFKVTENEDMKDYLYDAQALRTLAGKKLHKKKNNLNAFLKAYEGRYLYRNLACSDRQDVWEFLDSWREEKGEDVEEHLDYEVHGIHDILRNCGTFGVSMGGVYIDGKLQAFTIGSYNEIEKMAVIHIEKANTEIRGLYQFINQQFLMNAFPDAVLVNREDDLGQEGLRQAKMSYNPIDFARKYNVEQINIKNH